MENSVEEYSISNGNSQSEGARTVIICNIGRTQRYIQEDSNLTKLHLYLAENISPLLQKPTG